AGTVHLSEPVEKYFAEINRVQGRMPWAVPVTLIQLATMTSGLDREPEDLATYLKGSVSDWEKVLVSALPHTRFRFEPDTQFFYSNIGYAILGAALGRAAGRPYTEYVTERILAPLGMKHSAFEPNPGIQSSITKGYDVRPDGGADSGAPEREHSGRGYK